MCRKNRYMPEWIKIKYILMLIHVKIVYNLTLVKINDNTKNIC